MDTPMCNEQKDNKIRLLGRNVTVVTDTKNGQIAKYKYFEVIWYGYAYLNKAKKNLKQTFKSVKFHFFFKL